MYLIDGVAAGSVGLVLLIAPHSMETFLGYPVEEPIIAGITFSLWFVLGVLSLAGLRSPIKFTVVLVTELFYKTVWIFALIIPRAIAGTLPAFGATSAVLFLIPIVGNSIVIPWRYFFAK